ncbi:MAG: energy-coupling factor transporter transmembrane protein EcfT [Clostridiales bacterium]|jgi:energy-coupling factor transport system permease protein|nr:energy-coupling factor transporter transmembrane protein EcfT [Clostridiales bacterium]
MNINITIGQFYPIDSKIHRLDPRAKLLATFVFIAALFFVNDIYGYILSALSIGVIILISKVPFKYLLKGLKAIIGIIIFTAVLNIFFAGGKTVIFSFYFIKITAEGLILAAKMATRLVLLVIASSMLTLTTSPIELTDGIEYVLKPFKKIGVPAHEIAMMMTIALRFIPTLMEEVDKIMKAQIARGADFDTGNIMQKAKSMIPLLVPLFISAFRRADDLAMAMEARCYQGDAHRTRMKILKFNDNDYIFCAILIAYAAVTVVMGIIL